MTVRRLALAALVCAIALLAAGCGGPLSKKQYEKEVQKIGREVDKSIQTLSPKAGDPPTATNIRDAAEQLDDAVSNLEGITPPTEIEKAHSLMIKGLRDMSDSFEKLADRLETSDDDKKRMETFFKWVTDAKTKSAIDELTEAQKLFAEKNYKVFPDTTGGSAGDAAPGVEGAPPGGGAPPEGAGVPPATPPPSGK